MGEEVKSKRAIGYCRVSTDEQSRNGLSLDGQEAKIRSFAKSQGWDLTEIYSDPGYSGKDLNRPGVSRMIQDAEAGRFDVILVYKVDRLSRRMKDLWYLLEGIFEPHKIGFKSISESFDTVSPTGRAFLGMLSVFAQLERDQTRERIKDALGFKKVKKEWIGHPPLGYEILARGDGKGGVAKDKHLTLKKDEAGIVKLIFQARASGRGLTGICRMLAAKGINGRKWSPIGISKILENPVYTGNGTHQPIISRRLFNKVQEVRKE
jgi:site-specific DNA recombinase